MSNDYLKLKLLAHSQNMLIAAESNQWQELVALEHSWQIMLQDAIDSHKFMVESIATQLLQNNAKLQATLTAAQKNLMQDSVNNSQAHKAIKSYLK